MIWTSAGRARSSPILAEETREPAYEVEEFTHQPGIYYEKIGELHPLETKWKIVIQINVTSLTERLGQLENYMQKTKSMCQLLAFAHKETCDNLYQITKGDYEKINKEMEKIKLMYQSPRIEKRGIIDGIGTIAKTLFGTMDANDEKLINEQLTLLQNKQQTVQHVTKNQIKILQETIAHIDKTEETIQRNEYLLANVTKNEATTRI